MKRFDEGLGMRQVAWFASISITATLMSGCQFIPFLSGGGEEPVEEQPVVVVDLEDTPADDAAADDPNATTEGEASGVDAENPEEAFDDPTVEENGSPTPRLPDALIPPTNPNEALQAFTTERSDPFSLIPSVPTVRIPEPPPGTRDTPDTSPPTVTTPPTQVEPPPPPPPPSTDLARATQVTGVVQVGNSAYAIVQAPNDATSRYVRQGEFVANGQVLVKRINVANQLQPTVVLEENGVEVIRAVGENSFSDAPTAAAEQGEPELPTLPTL